MNDTVRLFNNSNLTKLNVGGVRRIQNPDAIRPHLRGPPATSPTWLSRKPGGFYRGPDVAPTPAAPLPFNPVFNFNGGLTLANDTNGRLWRAELAHFGKAKTRSATMPFVDSAGDAARF